MHERDDPTSPAEPPGPAMLVLRAALLAVFTVWGARLWALDVQDATINESFIHGPLLVFHEAGHVLFRLFGETAMVAGGSLNQLLVPAVLAGALWVRNRDAFGAGLGIWLMGVSLLDLAPYIHDALYPQLMLTTGGTGEEGGHDWIWLLDEFGNHRLDAPRIARRVHGAGGLVLLAGLLVAGVALGRQALARISPLPGGRR